ncbi:BREX-1 system adenine-specific DNA-methyltransferase PglX [Burkholderia gladioli]|uniref:site-specific DNA-methyltransferase (adenine-specific) n=1 Tax=Burkholderia gladioli (strain BSR3) TaxID=999541 RepID=F2LB29_BURGS|nr:BREX-1 system adenine-specific DNA-methyltransferase PglX [Burkholderia gladioli]AEA60098.1 putative restriction enzyme [Burkholderia gladioli BSR3]
MNKANLKAYAPQARLDFIAAVSARANLLGISIQGVAPAETRGDVAIIEGREWPKKVLAQRQKLIARIEKEGFSQTIEAVTYTWFNRFVALRFMELHDYLAHGCRVLSNRAGGQPEVLSRAAELDLPGLPVDRIRDMQLAGNQDNELYKLLIVAQCNELSRVMPFLFERIDDESELLLPDNLLRTDSVIARLIAGVPEEDWAQIESIGWLYQFYISERKDEVIGKVVETADIPAATQLFTPNWIVKYLVQNSVGRLWLEANPESALAQGLDYYLPPAAQVPEAQADLDRLVRVRIAEDGVALNPESITIFDPACGSGHMLVEAYELLKAIYLERGYRPRDIPRLILEKNLYGLDIDERAVQLASFALLMKARADDRRLLDAPLKLNICAVQDSVDTDDALIANIILDAAVQIDRGESSGSAHLFGGDGVTDHAHSSGLQAEDLRMLVRFFRHGKAFGSLLIPPVELVEKLSTLSAVLDQVESDGNALAKQYSHELRQYYLRPAQLLAGTYDAVIANPPYMNSGGMNAILKAFAQAEFPDSKLDLFSMFIERGFRWCKETGFNCMVTMQSWMFLSSFETMREKILANRTIASLVQIGFNSFPEINSKVAQACTFCIAAVPIRHHVAQYVDLNTAPQSSDKDEVFRKRTAAMVFSVDQTEFGTIPGSPIAYWASDRFRELFASGRTIEDIAFSKQGLATGENGRFIRLWHEVSIGKIGLSMDSRAEAKASGKKWFPHLKGGAFRRWYGNFETVVNWEDDGREVRAFGTENGGRARSRAQNVEFYFKPGITWSDLTSTFFGSRQVPQGFIINTVGPSLFAKSGHSLDGLLGYTNSRVFQRIVDVSLQGLHYNNGVIGSRPYVPPTHVEKVRALERELVAISRRDWDAYEGSWEFPGHPCASAEARSLDNLEAAWNAWAQAKSADVRAMLALEESNNQFFIDAYGLNDEISPTVSEEHITLVRPDRVKDAQRFVSYAIGCMMGRYSLDEPGLIYAHAGGEGFDPTRYASFAADADGILPTMDLPWFDDDGAQRIREFVGALWGVERADENLEWLAQSLGPKSDEAPEETIRRYVADSFFRDHVQVYKKRPVYWLFSSGRQGAFQALVYMHRYNERTLARLRSEYVVPLSTKLVARLELLDKDAAAASSSSSRSKLQKQIDALRKKHAELLSFDEKLRHYADMRIQIDLDDGVKVNYAKFGELLADSKTVTGGSDD